MESAVIPHGAGDAIGGADHWESLPGCTSKDGTTGDSAWEKPEQPTLAAPATKQPEPEPNGLTRPEPSRLEQLLDQRLAAIEAKLEGVLSMERKVGEIHQHAIRDADAARSPPPKTRISEALRNQAARHSTHRRTAPAPSALTASPRPSALAELLQGAAAAEARGSAPEPPGVQDEAAEGGGVQLTKVEELKVACPGKTGDSPGAAADEPHDSDDANSDAGDARMRAVESDDVRKPSKMSGVTTDSKTAWEKKTSAFRKVSKGSKGSKGSTLGNLMIQMPGFWNKVVNRSKRAEQIWNFFEEPESSWAATLYSRCMFIFLLGSTVIPVMQTLEEKPMTNQEFFYVSTFVDIIFLVELAVRWAVSPSTVGFLLGFYNLLDLAILGPFILRITYFQSLGDDDSENLLVEGILLCIVPVMRVIKALRTLTNFSLLWHTMKEASMATTIPTFMLVLIVMTFSSALYVLEPRDNVASMPYAMWLVAVTISTVGYGDVYPVTDWGRLVTMFLIWMGLHFMAMPIAIVGAAFLETWKNRTRILCVGRMHGRLRQWGYTEDDLRIMFKSFDADDSGELDVGEFTKMIDTMRLGLSKEAVEKLFNVFDDDKSGDIDIEEFVEGMGLNNKNVFSVF